MAVLVYTGIKYGLDMLRIVVFDGGCGGENVANYLAEELGVVEVISVIDAKRRTYEKKSLVEVYRLAEKNLRGYIGKVDLIVLGGYMVSTALDMLRQRYPEQEFVGMGVNYYRIYNSAIYPERITVMMNETLIDSPLCDELRQNLPRATLAVPDFSGWETLAYYGKLTKEVMREDLEPYFELRPKSNRQMAAERAALKKDKSILEKVMMEKYYYTDENGYDRALVKSDVVLLLNTCLWGVRDDIEYIFGYKARVLDFRQKLLHDVCTALRLKGVDGGRSK